jgi:MFS family permease
VLADQYGRKLLFQTGLVIFTLGSLLCGLAQDPLMLILSRDFVRAGRTEPENVSQVAGDTGADAASPARSA